MFVQLYSNSIIDVDCQLCSSPLMKSFYWGLYRGSLVHKICSEKERERNKIAIDTAIKEYKEYLKQNQNKNKLGRDAA